MELDDLKELWQKQSLHQNSHHSEQEIQHLLSKKTSSILSKINRSILFEGFVTLLMLFASIAFLIYDVQSQIMLFLTVLIILLLFNYVVKYRVLNNVIREEETLKRSLNRIIYILDTYLKAYWFVGWLTMVGVGITYSYNIYQEYQLYLNETIQWEEFRFMAGFLVCFYIVYNIAFYFLIKWYYDFFYGKYLQNLKECYNELEEYQEAA